MKTIASPLLKGGWRLPAQSAFLAMADIYESLDQRQKALNLVIYILDPREYQEVSILAGSMGWSTDT